MILFALAYLIVGSFFALLIGVNRPLGAIITLAFWPLIVAIVIIDMARNSEG